MTKREFYTNLMNNVTMDKETIVAFAKHEIELLDKKVSSNSKRKEKNAKEYKELESKIEKVLEDVKSATCSDIANELGLSTQKISPRLKAMVSSGKVTVAMNGKTKLFSLA